VEIDPDPPEVRARMIGLLRQAGSARRLALARSLTIATRAMSWAGQLRRHPERPRAEAEAAFVGLMYGVELANRLTAWRAQRCGRGS
jgi:hypothetical protein